jgi:hypothetical protein
MNVKPTWHERVKRLAQEIYEREGRPEGRAREHWLAAEKQLKDEDRFLEEELRVEEAEGGLVPKA